MTTKDSVNSAVADSGGVQGHTPGPWMLVKDEFIYTVDGQLVGQAFRQAWSAEPLTEEEATANGRIQAAAPDLLEALINQMAATYALLEWVTEVSDEYLDGEPGIRAQLASDLETARKHANEARAVIGKATGVTS